MNSLEQELTGMIEEWVAGGWLDSEKSVANAIAETNYIFDEEYCDDVELTKLNDTSYSFECRVTMSGEPRKDDVVFCGDTINVVIRLCHRARVRGRMV